MASSVSASTVPGDRALQSRTALGKNDILLLLFYSWVLGRLLDDNARYFSSEVIVASCPTRWQYIFCLFYISCLTLHLSPCLAVIYY